MNDSTKIYICSNDDEMNVRNIVGSLTLRKSVADEIADAVAQGLEFKIRFDVAIRKDGSAELLRGIVGGVPAVPEEYTR